MSRSKFVKAKEITYQYIELDYCVREGRMGPQEAIYIAGLQIARHENKLTCDSVGSFARFVQRMVPKVSFEKMESALVGHVNWDNLADLCEWIDMQIGGLVKLGAWLLTNIGTSREETRAAIESLLAQADQQTTPGAEGEVKPGGANNPTGRNQYTAPVEPVVPSDGVEVNDDNVNIDQKPRTSKTGNSSDLALRRLTKAAKGQKSHGTVPSPDLQAKCQSLLERVARREISVNRAAIEAGFRRQSSPLDRALADYRKLSPEDKAAFLAAIAAA